MTRPRPRSGVDARHVDPEIVAADVAARRRPALDAITASARRVEQTGDLPTKVAVRVFNALGNAADYVNRELDQLEGKGTRS